MPQSRAGHQQLFYTDDQRNGWDAYGTGDWGWNEVVAQPREEYWEYSQEVEEPVGESQAEVSEITSEKSGEEGKDSL
jgi:hypothetical protein